jgi:hypothetical protein
MSSPQSDAMSDRTGSGWRGCAGRQRRARLVLPIASVAIGVGYLVAGLIGGQTWFAIEGLVLMSGIAVVLLLVRGRSETVAGLMDRRDERINALDLRATALTGGVLVVAVLVGFVVDIARGGDGQPYVWLGALGGVTYLVALIVLRFRG